MAVSRSSFQVGGDLVVLGRPRRRSAARSADAAGGGPSAPLLILISIVSTTVTFAIDIDNTIVAGDTIRLQIQTPPGGNWSSPVFNNTHVITAPEDAANEVDLTASLVSGNYDARALVRKGGVDSPWSNTVTFTI